MIMASFKTTFVATLLLYFSYSFLIGCAQQYEYDSSAEARVSNWQSSRTSRTRNGDSPSRFDVKNSSPDVAARNRPRTQSRYEGDGIARPPYDSARQYTEEQPQRVQMRGRQRTRQRVSDAGRTIERRADEVTQPAPVTPRRRSNRVRVTESTTQASGQFSPRLRVPMEDTLANQPRGFASPRDITGRSRQRVKEEIPIVETSTVGSPRQFSRGRVKAKIYDTPRRSSSSKADDVNESDNYPPGFIEKIKSSESSQPSQADATPRRSRLRQRAAKTYPSIALSDANRFRQRYTRPTTSTEKSQSTSEVTPNEETPTKRSTLLDPRQRSRSRYTTPKITTDYAPKPFRSYSRRFSVTEKKENSTSGYTTTISPRQKYLSRLRSANIPFKTPIVVPDNVVEVTKKEEALEPAENSFYTHPDDMTTEEPKQYMKNMDVDLEGDASEEDERVETEKTTERPTTTSITTTAATTISTTTSTTAATTRTTTAATAASISSTKANARIPIPTTRHRFSSRFSRSNKTTTADEVTRSTPESDSLVLDSVTPAPINLTSLFDDTPDSTLSITALFNNSFNASSSVATNKTNSPETLTNTTNTATTSTARPSTVTENSSTNLSATSTKRAKKKKSQKKPRKSNKTTTTASPIDGLNDRPILRNIVSLFGNPEPTTKRSSGKRNSSRTRTTTTTSTPGPREIARIQNIINETMEVIQNRSSGPAPVRLVPRVALNALTPETSVEETTNQPSTTTTTTTTNAPTTTTTSSPTTTTTTTSSPTTTTTTTSAPSTTTTIKTTATTSTARSNTTTTRTTITTTTSTSTARSAALSNETPKRNCTSQFVYFDYNSDTPIPQQYANFQKARTSAITSTTEASTTADYFVYGVYPNNTIVRKRAWKTFDYEKYHSPYVIFGIYPNNTIIKKFPNGTIINDEFMTSDNEIRDIMGLPRKPSTTTTRRPETTATTKESVTTTTTSRPVTTTVQPATTTKKPETTTVAEMRMAGSVTTEDILEEITTEEESPDSMFEIIENEIEREERKDEELGSGTTEVATTTVSLEEVLRLEERIPSTTTETNAATTTEEPSRSAENIEATTPSVSTTEASVRPTDTTPSVSTTEASVRPTDTTPSVSTTEASVRPTDTTPSVSTTETSVKPTDTTPSVSTTETTDNVVTTTLKNSREGKSFLNSDIFSENIVDNTTGRVSTTTIGSVPRETTEPDLFGRLSDEVESDVSTTTERTASTTDLTDRTTEDLFDLLQVFQPTTTRYDSSRSFDIDINVGDGPVYRPSTTEASAEESSTEARSFFDLEGGQVVSTTTEAPSTLRSTSGLSENRLVESTTTEASTTQNSLFDIFEIDLFESTTVRGPTTTGEFSEASGNNLIGSSTTEVPTTSRSSLGLSEINVYGSTTTETPTTTKSLFGLSESDLFGPTTTVTPTTSRPVFRSSGSTTAGSITTEVPTTLGSLFSLSENSLFGSTTTDIPTTTRSVSRQSDRNNLVESAATEIPTTLRSLFGLSENSLFGSTTTDSPTTPKPVFRQSGSSLTESTTTESPTTSRSLFGLSENDLFGSMTTEAITTKSTSRSSGSRLVESTTTEITTTLGSLFGLSEANLFGPTTTETPGSSESTAVPNTQNEIVLLSADLFQLPESEASVTRSTMTDDEQAGLVNLAYRALGSSNTITTAPTPTTTTKTLKYITSTMKSTNYREKKVRMKMKRTSTSTPKSENVFIVTPVTTISETDYGKKGKVKFVTLTPGVIVTTDVRDENDVITMSSQHVQKVTKAPANIPDNFLTDVVGEIQEKSSSPIPDILKNVEKELQGNGISVSLARRIIEMAIERAVTTEVPQTTGQIRETTLTTPYVTTRRTPGTTAYSTPTPPPYRIESTTTSNEISTVYNDLFSTVNLNPLSVGFVGDTAESTTKVNEEGINRLVQGLWKEQTQTTTVRTTTTTKSSKRTKSSRNPASSGTTLSQNDKLLLEAILKQQNSNLSVQELDRIIENQIRLAEEVRKASKNMKKKPRVTTTTTTTTQTPPLFGFLISLFSGNSSPSNIPVTRSPIKQTRSRLKSSRVPGSMTNNPKKPDPLKEAEVGNPSGERSTRGELVTAAIDVTKAVSKFMGTFLSSAAQSFQAFFSNFGRGR